MKKRETAARSYEALFIIDPAKEGSLKEITRGIAQGIEKQEGVIEKEESWGKQRISYPIRKNPEGIFYKVDFSISPSQVVILDSGYKLNPDILRVMITAK